MPRTEEVIYVDIVPHPEAPEGFPYLIDDLVAITGKAKQTLRSLLDAWQHPYKRQAREGANAGHPPHWYSEESRRALVDYFATGKVPGADEAWRGEPIPDAKYCWPESTLNRMFSLQTGGVRFLLLRGGPKPPKAHRWISKTNGPCYTQEVYEYLIECVLTIGDIAAELDISSRTARAAIQGTQYESVEAMAISGRGRPIVLPWACLAFVWHRTAASRTPRASNRWKLLVEAAEELGMTPRGLRLTIKSYPQFGPVAQRRFGNTKPAAAMKGTAFRALANWLPEHAPEGWRTIRQHSLRTGWSREKITRHVKRTGAEHRPYRAASGVVEEHYHDDGIDLLGRRPRHVPPGGDWLTERAIAARLDQDGVPNARRFVKENLNRTGVQDRITDTGSIRPHYPPSELQRLRRLRP